MTAPANPSGDDSAGVGPVQSGNPPPRLKRRRDFLAVARGTRVHAHAFSLQANKRSANTDECTPSAGEPRVGLTTTRRIGGAVERNRIRRRLREALRAAKALSTEPDTDYVVVARREALSVSFARLTADLESAVRRAGTQLKKPRGSGKDTRRERP